MSSPEDSPAPEMAKFYTLTADYGRLLQLGGRSVRVGPAPSKPLRLTEAQVAQAAGAGCIATPADVTTENRQAEAPAQSKVLPPAGDNQRPGKVLDSTLGRGTRPGPMIPPDLPIAEPAPLDAEKEQ